MRLYELLDNFEALLDRAFDESDDEGALSAEFTTLLQGLEAQIEVKFEQLGYVLKNLESWETALKAEELRLAAKRKRATDRFERVKDYVKGELIRLGKESGYVAGIFKFRVQNNSQASITILDEKLVPVDCWRQPPAEIDKSLIAAALKSGLDVPGVQAVRGSHLRVL